MSDTTDLTAPAPADANGQEKKPEITRWVWRAMEPDERETRLMELTGWADEWLVRAHPKVHAKIPRCWQQHEEIIEHLTALFLGWARTYAGDPGKLSLRAEMEWISGMHSLKEHLGSPACQAGNVHQEPPARKLPNGELLEEWMDTDPEFLNAPAKHPAQAEVSRMVAARRAAEEAKAEKG
ncbi:hypothetical protein [Streptomyces sp. NPDC093223]|uniref:hypothetical protein n=1 Tax=Streptomyces sp. NPDC093223 TaxID=3366033 RepID=UPI00380904C6